MWANIIAACLVSGAAAETGDDSDASVNALISKPEDLDGLAEFCPLGHWVELSDLPTDVYDHCTKGQYTSLKGDPSTLQKK